MSPRQAQELGRTGDQPEDRIGLGNQRQVVAAVLNCIVEAQIGSRLGQPRGIPVEEVLRAERQLGIQGEVHRDLIARNEQLLGLGTRYRQGL
ncbi:hypothetical protein D9M68_984090 [compost metagenome]